MGYTVNTNDFVEQFFEMDPATDDLIFDGTNLRNGMVVLIEDDSLRRAVSDISSLRDRDRAQVLRYQRWAKVSCVSIDMQTTRFIATYADGSKRKIAIGTNNAWYVKKDSMTADEQVPGQVSIPVVDLSYGPTTPRDVLSTEGVSYSPFDRATFPPRRENPANVMGKAPVPPLPPSLADTGTIPRISWNSQDAKNIEEPAHFNQTRETWEQNRGGAPIN